jgi:hypothetical protein
MAAVTVLAVPKSRRAPTRPPRSTQIEDEWWERFGGTAEHLGLSRAALLEQCALYMARKPGVTLPRRPTEEQIAAGMAALAAKAAARADREAGRTDKQSA